MCEKVCVCVRERVKSVREGGLRDKGGGAREERGVEGGFYDAFLIRK